MRPRAKPTQAKIDAKRSSSSKAPKNEGARVRDLEKRLAEALAREAKALTQLQTRSHEVAEAHEQLRATSEILRVISSSPTDLQPVAQAIADSASRLCDCTYVGVFRFDGELIHWVAARGASPEQEDALRSVWPRPPGPDTLAGRTVLARATCHVHDTASDAAYTGNSLQAARALLVIRSFLGVPMLRDGEPIGVIALVRSRVRPFSEQEIALVQTFADQAVIAIENVRLFTELQASNRDLTVSLEQQTATAEVLRVIAAAQADVQPVFDTIAANAMRLCAAAASGVYRFDGELIHVVALLNVNPERTEALRRAYPVPPNRGSAAPRAVLTRDVVYIRDVREDPDYRLQGMAVGFRSVLAVPMLREGNPIGAIGVTGTGVGAFSDNQVELLKTFADQAVIAIENVRLFTELQERNRNLTEALQQQTATGEVLRAIAASPTELEPVLATVIANAVRLVGAKSGHIREYDGEFLRITAPYNESPAQVAVLDANPVRPTIESAVGRAFLERRVVHIPDVQADPQYRGPLVRPGTTGRTVLAVPLLREGMPIGTISIWRAEVEPFTQRQINLVTTFADQAVIAIENVRLFRELDARNRDLTEALEQQTATAEVLKVISRSTFDLQPVLDTLIENAARLCASGRGVIMRRDGDSYHGAAFYNVSPELIQYIKRHPIQPGRHSITARVALERRTIHVADLQADAEYRYALRDTELIGTELGVPMFRGDDIVGVIILHKLKVQPFTDKQIELVETFADQAVIAIENVRLFKDREQALERQTATADILRLIGKSPTDAQPVFDGIARSGVKTLGALGCVVFVVSGDMVSVAATHNVRPERVDRFRTQYPAPFASNLEFVTTVREGIFHLADIEHNPDATPEQVEFARLAGYRTRLMAPMMRGDTVLGIIAVTREAPAPFFDEQVKLLRTFADQAVMAIENVRLFKELEARNKSLIESLEQQTATADVLKVISRSTFDLQPVLNTLIESATRLCGTDKGFIFRRDGDVYRGVADHGTTPEHRDYIHRNPVAVDRNTVVGRVALERRTIHFPDILVDSEYRWAEAQRIAHFRTVLGVPMLREGAPIGVFFIWREEVLPFTDKQIELVTTFAAQAVIAIENVRLFTELQARTADLTRSVDRLTALSEVGRAVSSTLDLDTVLQTIVSRAVQLTGTDGGSIYEYDAAAEEFEIRATRTAAEEIVEAQRFIRLRKGEGVVGQLANTKQAVQVPDITAEGAYTSRMRGTLIRAGVHSLLAVPLLRDDELIGALVVTRRQVGAFAAETIDLLRTFATQSALAIQNARLFHEIEDKSRQLEAASQHKSEFLANMSHELRTPLNAIIGFSEVLGERLFGDLNAKQEEYLKDIHASGQHLLSLINDILDLSKIEAGRMELELTDFHLPTALDNALTLVRERAGRRGIALHMSTDDRLEYIRADERKIKQVLLNLLSNAIKFTPEGGRIEVRARPVDGSVEVSVTDTGVGIAPEDQEAIFEEFRQVGTADKKVEGTGLGLALSRKFIELHGGRIWVYSEVGTGSRLTFSIPVRRGE